MRFVRAMLVGLAVAGGAAGLVGLGLGRVEAKDRTIAPPGQKSAADSGVATLQVYSRETVVDVTVVDGDGKPVLGLKQADFTVEEDGKAQPIRSFQEFGVMEASAPRAMPNLPPNVYTNLQAATGTLNILLLDLAHLDVPSQIRAIRGAAEYVKTMPAGTQVAVYEITSRLSLLQPPTSDRASLLKALDIHAVPPSGGEDQCLRAARAKNWIYGESCVLEQLNQIASYVAGVKGKKNLIWFGPGMPTVIFPNSEFDFTQELRMTYDLLAAAQVSVDTVDPRGVETIPGGCPHPPCVGAEMAAAEMAWLRTMGKSQLAQEAIAEATGGEAFYNSNDIAGLVRKAVDRGANYYTLSYAPESFAYDGKYHAISVKVDRPGVRLIYRTGYSAEDTSAKPSTGPTLMQVAMGQGAPNATQLLFDVRVQPTPAGGDDAAKAAIDPKAATDHRALGLAGKAAVKYDVLFALPASQIAFGEGVGGTHSGSLEFDVAAYNSDGKLVNLVSQTMQLPLTAEEYGQFVKTPFQFFQQIDLPPGQAALRVGILDGVSNKVGTMEIPVTVAKGAAATKAGK